MANTAVNLNGYQRNGGGIYLPVNVNEAGELLQAQGSSPYQELSRQGIGWSVMNVLAIAALVVRPTTVAAVEIWNGSPTISLVIEDLMALHLVSTAAANNAGLWAFITKPKATPSAGANIAPWGDNGKAYNGATVVGLGTTVVDTPTNGNGWFPWGPSYSGPATATPGGSWRAPVQGKLIVPPLCSLGIHVVASLVGDTFQVGAHWYEKTLTLQ